MNNSIENLYNKGSKETTATSLDNLILNAAKQSCEPKIIKQKTRPWMVPLASAAVFVMGFTVIFNLQNESNHMQEAPSFSKLDETTKVEFNHENKPPLEPHTAKRNAQAATLKREETEQSIAKDFEVLKNKEKTDTTQDKPNPIIVIAKPKPEIEIRQKKVEDIASTPVISKESSNKLISANESTSKEAKAPTKLDSNTKQFSQVPLVEDDLVITGKITDGALGLNRENSSDNYSETKSYEPDKFEDKNEDEDRVELERVVTTGSRISSGKIQKNDDILKLEDLIIHKRFAKAKRLLKKLKRQYPDYDFVALEKLMK